MVSIDEGSRRRPDFKEGQPLELRDGQVWHLRLPALVLGPRYGDEGRVSSVVVGRGGVPDYDRGAAILYGEETVPREEYWRVRFACASCLLRSNYDLADGELAELLRYTVGDEDDVARWEVLDRVFLGLLPDRPKPDAGGSR